MFLLMCCNVLLGGLAMRTPFDKSAREQGQKCPIQMLTSPKTQML